MPSDIGFSANVLVRIAFSMPGIAEASKGLITMSRGSGQPICAICESGVIAP